VLGTASAALVSQIASCSTITEVFTIRGTLREEGEWRAAPLAETITISRHLPTPENRVFINESPLADLRNPDTLPPMPAYETGRSSQRFVMDVVACEEILHREHNLPRRQPTVTWAATATRRSI
jgi:hypothetical protein